jgi:UDP:flavonoid glycosyltransferase YjiC (YdhE family)
MKRFLFAMVEGGGNVPPQLGAVRRLVARGHAVRVLGDRALAAEVAEAGAEFAPWQRAPHNNMRDRRHDRVRDWEPKSPIAKMKRVAKEVLFGPAELYARDLLDEVERFSPDALAVDCLLFGAAIGAEKSGLPAAVLMHTICYLPLPGVPPYSFGLSRARGPLGRVRDRLLWRLFLHTFDKEGIPPLNGARAALGLPPIRHVTDGLSRLSRVLILTSASFDFVSTSLPDHVRYVGAPVDDPAWAGPAPVGSEPLVLVALGSTFQNQAALTQRVIDACGQLPLRALVTLGDVFAPSDFRAPANVDVVGSAPHNAVLPRARITVAHGGHGTVIKSLAAGVPVLCVPLGRDQKDNGARVVDAGAGLTLSPGASTATICRTMRRLLDEPSFAEAARRMRDAIAAERAGDPLLRELEALADGGMPCEQSLRRSLEPGPHEAGVDGRQL